MFGYRVIRQTDLEGLSARYDALNRGLHELRAQAAADVLRLSEANFAIVTALHERLTTVTGEAKARAAMVNLLTVQVNVANADLATYRQKATGLPQVVAAIGKGSALSASNMGVGADLFEDVGDERAAELIQRGVIAAPEGMPDFPAAGRIAPQ